MDYGEWPMPTARAERLTRRAYYMTGFDPSTLTSALGKRVRPGSGPGMTPARITNRNVLRLRRSTGVRISPAAVYPRTLYARPDVPDISATRSWGNGHIDGGAAGMAGARGRLSAGRSSYPRAGMVRSSSRTLAPYSQRRGYKRLINYTRLHQPMRGFLGPAGDQKFHDVAFFGSVMNTTGAISHLDVIPTGTGVSTREGKCCQITSFQVRGECQSGTTTAVALGAVYFVWDYQPNKALAAVLDVLDTASANSFIKRENASRFRILAQRHYSMTGLLGTPATGCEQFAVEEFIRVPASSSVVTCTINDTTGVIADRVSGALLMVTVGDTAAGTAAPNYNVGIRVNFRDI